MSLTDKQKAFVREYLIDSNGTQAAIRAGYSENSARQIADQLMSKEEIKQAIRENQKNLEQRSDLSKLDILEMHKQIAELTRYDINHCHKAIKAASEISRMLGYYEAEKHEHSGGLINFNLKLDEE